MEHLSNLPPFSPILNRLLAMMGNDDVPFSTLGAQIEKDTVLAGNILKIVNSALYGRTGTVTSIVHAISILGTARLRNCALAFSVNRLWNNLRTPSRWSAIRFNTHSLATAMMADRLAELRPIDFAEGAFASGLFHDLGKLLIAMTSAREYEILHKEFQAAGPNIEQRERELLGVTHSELSAMALERWNLPKPVQSAVLHHHSPELYSALAPNLAHLVHAANATVRDLGFTIDLPAGADHHRPETFVYLEELNVPDIPAFIASFETALNTLTSAG